MQAFRTRFVGCVCLLLQYLLQSCSRGVGRGEDIDLGFGLTCGQNSVCQTEPKTEAASVCPNRTDIEGKPKTIFFLFFFSPIVSEDLLNRQIQVHGLVSPERAKNNVWFFFRKYNPKKLEGPNNLRLAQHALCTICLEDITRRRLCTVQMGKDNSQSPLLDHMKTHHLEEYNAWSRVFVKACMRRMIGW